MRSHTFCFVIALMSLTAIVGCGGGNAYEVAPVSGRVTLNDKPLAGATVTFEPAGTAAELGPSSFGKTDSDGRYVLETVTNSEPGATVGNHVVRITADSEQKDSDAPDPSAAVGQIPLKYNLESELKFEVTPSGTTKADFDLKKP